MNNNVSDIKRVCVYGVGGVGGYFGGKIANAITTSGTKHEIYFIARGEHLNVIKREGIKVVTPEETIVGVPTIATHDVEEIPNPDLFLICVKSYDLDEVIRAIIQKVTSNTIIIPSLNGADIYERVRANLDSGIVLPACLFLGTHIEKPGVIKQSGGDGIILFGNDPRESNLKPNNVISFFRDVRIQCRWNEDPYPAIWGKYIFIASFGLVTAYTGKTLGEIMGDEESKEMVRAVMNEISSIAKEMGIGLPDNIIEESIDKANNFPYETKTSYQRDLESKGNVNEGDLYGDTIIRKGQALKIPTPITRLICLKIKQQMNE